MRTIIPDIHASGAELVVIGNGNRHFAQGFMQTQQLGTPLFVDPSLESYRAAGLHRGVWRTLGPEVWKHGLRAFKAGHRQQRTQGDPWQEGGVFVIRTGGDLAFSHISETAGDHPSPADIVSALGEN